MGSHSLPSPPAADYKSTLSRKSTSSRAKSVKPVHRASKRASSNAATIHHHGHVTHSASVDGRHKRCDGELPCKRCKGDGLVCTASVLENTQFALIATVHKLYSMVRNNQPWELGEPELNDRGLPVIHNIAQKLGCIRPNSDIDLSVHSVFPEDEAGMAELARQLKEPGKEQKTQKEAKDTDFSVYNRIERASSSELEYSDFKHDYRKAAFGSKNAMTLSPQSFTGNNDFEFAPPPPDMDATTLFPSQSPSIPNFPTWAMTKPQPNDLTMQFQQRTSVMQNIDLQNQGLVESDFSTIKPHVLSCPNPEVVMGIGDLMIYSGYDGQPMRI
ncbi:hypothetical protein BKA56DRAFT_637341 [Ilyonectria sp. MPI-CAGE-AT-0026]|nr:hypothetical protein BKA56DRAFT_637341 [Ilyonectria sp. MPI-CAGE-AT-0026]